MVLSTKTEASLQLMIYHPIKEIWFYLLAAALLAAISGYGWQYRRTPAALYWVLSLVLRAFFLLALVIIGTSTALVDKVFWVKIQHICGMVMLPIFFLFVVHIAGKNGPLARWVTLALLTISGVSIVALLTTEWHGWYWRGVVWDGVTFGIIRGPIYWAMFVLIYLQFLVVSILCVIWGLRISGLRRWQILVLPIDPIISITGHIFWAIDQRAGILPPLPLAFILSGIVWCWLFLRLRILSLMSLAESTVIGNIDDCMIIIDDQDYIVDLNPSVQRRFGQKAPLLIGSHFAEVFAPWPAMTALLNSREVTEGEFSLEGSGHYSYHITPLKSLNNMIIGKAIVLHDMTSLKQAQTQILDQQKAFSIMAERERLGRELHDGQGQIWNYINLKLQTARSFLKGGQFEKADQQVAQLIGTIKELNTDARESIIGLKMTANNGDNFIANIQDYLEWFSESNGIVTQLILTDPSAADLLSRTSKVQLLRIIQEALTNVRKHANASKVTVKVEKVAGQVIIQVEDDGCGFDPATVPSAQKSFGLQIMAERAAEVAGCLVVNSAPGAGTKLTIQILLDKVINHESTVS